MRSSLLLLALPAATSGLECTANVLHNTKCPDKAYDWTNVTSWGDCCAACDADSKCLAFVFDPIQSQKNCHLKERVTKYTDGSAHGITCGVFPGGGPPAPTPPAPTPPTPPAPTPAPDPSAPRPHLMFLLQDDLGFDDIGYNNPESKPYSQSITALAQDGMVLTNHYVHWHCSPTRRSFLTGRLPIHHGEMLSGLDTDDIDLRWKTLPEKLVTAGYHCYWFGKGHTGYKSMAHMPTNRGFREATFFMGGAQGYTSEDRWKDAAPYSNGTYATYLYGDETLRALDAHDPEVPIFLYLPYQAVHAPYDAPPDPKPDGTVLQQMLWAADTYVGRTVDTLKKKGMWETTLVVYSADNGGTTDGTNFPKRGQKHTNFQGGMNVAAFVSGGFLPKEHRGTSADVALHIVDWYATFCALAGVAPTDDSLVPPQPIDPSMPPVLPPPKDIYGGDSWAGVDGVDVWSILLDEERRMDPAAAHPELTLSREVILVNGTWKIIVAQPDPSILAMKTDMPPHRNETLGWRYRNHSFEDPDMTTCGLNFLDRGVYQPCLFNIQDDPEERKDIAAELPELMQDLWGRLNRSFLTFYHSRTPADMLGHCDKTCAKAHWKSLGGKGDAPFCGVPGCDSLELTV